MQLGGLGIREILEFGSSNFPDAKIFSYYGSFSVTHTFADVSSRAARLANALGSLGVGSGDRVATFAFNHNQHMEAYLGVPAMGAVLHTLNIRLFPDQLAFIIDDAEDLVIIADNVVAGLILQILPRVPTVKHLVVIGPQIVPGFAEKAAEARPGLQLHDYEELLAAAGDTYDWPDLDETSGAMMCYTSGTTGDPKGVVYSHRSIYLHAVSTMSLYSRRSFSLAQPEGDRALIIVPMFHAAAWGTPYGCWLTGSDMIMPTRFLQAAPLAEMISTFKPTLSSGVPTIWNDLYHYLEEHPADLSCFRFITSGGSATPRSLIDGFLHRYGVPLMSGWGMTETSPICTLAIPPPGTPTERVGDYLETAGKPVAGVMVRLVGDDGQVVPHDGESVGEIEVKGPWITGSYYKLRDAGKFDAGWLRTGDVGSIDAEGYLRIVDREKDVIKSGGEWISSIELENALMAHPRVKEAAVIGVPDEKWFERPLAMVVLTPGGLVTPAELTDFLAGRVAKWWLPERFSFVDELPKTSVGKFDKKVLRAQYERGELEVRSKE